MTAGDDYSEILARLDRFQKSADQNGVPKTSTDPTTNVLTLVAAAMQRQDDLREAESRRRDSLAEQRDHFAHEIRILDNEAQKALAQAESRRIDAVTIAESRRIDALLAAQQSAVALATTRAELTAGALAERVDTSAKTLAASVDTTAKALAQTFDVTVKALAERIVPLEQARYEQAGSKETRGESRAFTQWTFERVLTLVGFGLGALYFILQSRP